MRNVQTAVKFPRRHVGMGRYSALNNYWRRPQRALAKVSTRVACTYATTTDPADHSAMICINNNPENLRGSSAFNHNILTDYHTHNVPNNWAEAKLYYKAFRVRGWKIKARWFPTYADTSANGANPGVIAKPFIFIGRAANNAGAVAWPDPTDFTAAPFIEMKKMSPYVKFGKDVYGGRANAKQGGFVTVKSYISQCAITDRTKTDMHDQPWTAFGAGLPIKELLRAYVGVTQWNMTMTAGAQAIVAGLLQISMDFYVEFGDPIMNTINEAETTTVDDSITAPACADLVALVAAGMPPHPQ